MPVRSRARRPVDGCERTLAYLGACAIKRCAPRIARTTSTGGYAWLARRCPDRARLDLRIYPAWRSPAQLSSRLQSRSRHLQLRHWFPCRLEPARLWPPGDPL